MPKIKLTAAENRQKLDLRDMIIVPIKGAANRRRMGGAAMLVRKPTPKRMRRLPAGWVGG